MPSLLRLRLLLGGLATGCGVALVVLSRHRSQAPVLGPFSPAALVALVLTAAAVVLLAGLALAPGRRLCRCDAAMRELIQWLASREPAMPPFAAAALLVLAAASYAALTARFFPLNPVQVADQREYLLLAHQIQHGSLADLIGPNYREANRHPLYPVILAWTGASEMNPTAFARAKCTSIALASLALAVLIILVARRFSLAVAALAAVLLATNLAFLRFTTLVACEGLLVLWAGLLWLTAEALPQGPPAAHDGGESASAHSGVPVAHRLVLGAWASLAYLTKGSALLLLIGLIVWLVVRRTSRSPLVGEGRGGGAARDRRTPSRHLTTARSVALVLVAFLLVASPLLVRNTRVYHNPFYNSNTPFLFSDSFEEALRRSDPSRPPEQNESTWTAARRYFRTHSVGQVAYRAAAGAVTELFILLRTLGPAPLQESRALVGAPIFLLALVGMAARPRPDALLVLIWLGLFIAFFGWYAPIAAGDRFVLPLVVPLYVYAASAIARLAAATRSAKATAALLVGAALWLAVLVTTTLLSLSFPAALARSIPQLRSGGPEIAAQSIRTWFTGPSPTSRPDTGRSRRRRVIHLERRPCCQAGDIPGARRWLRKLRRPSRRSNLRSRISTPLTSPASNSTGPSHTCPT